MWLASYPKSGNTWMRSFLTALLREAPPDINALATDGIFSSKAFVELATDVDEEALSPRDWAVFRREALRYRFEASERSMYLKVHDAYTYDPWTGEPLVPSFGHPLVLYLIRNPLDVAVSFAHHNHEPVEKTVRSMGQTSYGLSRKPWQQQSWQPMGTWSMHAQSWLEQPHLPVHVMRYEDMRGRLSARWAFLQTPPR